MAGKPLDLVARFRTVTNEFRTDSVERELDSADRAFRESGRAARRWSDDVDDAARDATRKGRFADAGREVGDEFAENIGEGLRNGDYAGVLTETFTSLTPALGAIGLGIGAALGVGTAIVADLQAKQERIRQMGRTIFDALSDGYMDAAEKENLLLEIFGTDDLSDAYRQLARKAKSLGVSNRSLMDELLSGGRRTTALDEAEARMLELDRKVRENGWAPRGPAAVELENWRAYWRLQEDIRKSIDQSNESLRVRESLSAGAGGRGSSTAYGSATRRDPDFTSYSGD